MWKPDSDILGECYVKHMEPIHLSTYLQKLVPHIADIRQPIVFERTALELSTHLLEKQSDESPVTLNAIISSWLLQEC